MIQTLHQQPVNLALVGVGSHMREHLFPALQQLPAVRVKCVAAKRAARAARFAEEHGIETWCTGWESVLEEKVDGIVVSGPPELHSAVLEGALSAHLPVFVEKPPAPGLESLQRLVDLEQRTACPVFVGYNFRFAQLVQELYRLIRHPSYLHLRFVSSKPLEPLWNLPSVEASYLYAVAIHALESALWTFGEVAEIMTQHCPLENHRFAGHVGLSFRSGRSALLELGNYGHRFDCRWKLVGSDGSWGTVDNLDRLSFSAAGGLSQKQPKAAMEMPLSGLCGSQHRGGYSQALEAFIEIIRKSKPSPSPLASNLPLYRLLESILESWRSNSSGDLKYGSW